MSLTFIYTLITHHPEITQTSRDYKYTFILARERQNCIQNTAPSFTKSYIITLVTSTFCLQDITPLKVSLYTSIQMLHKNHHGQDLWHFISQNIIKH